MSRNYHFDHLDQKIFSPGGLPAAVCPALKLVLTLQTAHHRLIVVGVKPAGLDAGFDLQAARYHRVVVGVKPASLDAGLDLQVARHCLAVVNVGPAGLASLDAAFDLRA